MHIFKFQWRDTTSNGQHHNARNKPKFALHSLALFSIAVYFCMLTTTTTTTVRASIDIVHKKHENHWSLTAAANHLDETAPNLMHNKHYTHNKEHVLPSLHLHDKSTKSSNTATTTTTTSLSKTPAESAAAASGLRSRAQHLSELSSLRNKCALAERELDRCSAQLIGLGQTDAAYPDNMQELDSVYCPRFRDTVACVRNNTDCYKPFERQIINWILSSTRRINYKRCKNENEKLRFLKLTNSCFATMRSPMDDCMARYIGSLDGIAEYNRDLERLSENDIQIQLACCANRRFKQCVMRSAKQSCQSHESSQKLKRTNSVSSQRVARKQLLRAVQDNMDDLRTTLDQMALTGPDFVCTGVDEHFCRSKYDGRYSNRQARHKSIVPAMIKIYANK